MAVLRHDGRLLTWSALTKKFTARHGCFGKSEHSWVTLGIRLPLPDHILALKFEVIALQESLQLSSEQQQDWLAARRKLLEHMGRLKVKRDKAALAVGMMVLRQPHNVTSLPSTIPSPVRLPYWTYLIWMVKGRMKAWDFKAHARHSHKAAEGFAHTHHASRYNIWVLHLIHASWFMTSSNRFALCLPSDVW